MSKTIARRGLLAAVAATPVALAGGDMYRSEDIAPLLAATSGDPGALRAAKGTVVTWNAATGTNTINLRGTLLTNLPIVASSSEVAQIQPGDQVVLHVFGAGGWSTAYIVGRIVYPGTPGAATALELQTKADNVAAGEATTSTAYTNLVTAGPEVTVTIGPTGRCMVTLDAWIQYSIGFSGNTVGGGMMAFRVDDGTTLAEDDSTALYSRLNAATAGNLTVEEGRSRTVIVEGLPPGSRKFTARYRMVTGAASVAFSDRNLIVVPL